MNTTLLIFLATTFVCKSINRRRTTYPDAYFVLLIRRYSALFANTQLCWLTTQEAYLSG